MSYATKTRPVSCTIAVVFLLTLLSSCGGSSGGGGGGGDDITIPEEFSFSLSIDELDPFTITDQGGSGVTLGTLAPVTGTYVVDSGICTLGRDSLINIVREGWEAPYNAFTIQVLSDITAETGRNPTQGSFKVTGGFPDTVSLTVVTSPSPGATISLNNGAQETYTWDELYALYLDENEEYWRWQASLSALIITRVIEEVIFSGDTLLQIEVNDDLLEDDGSITYSGSPFPGSTPPSGVPVQQGTQTLSWTDTSWDSVLGPGDGFSWNYYWYWNNIPSEDIDLLYFGNVRMLGFLENSDGDEITSVGFMPEGSAAGGVFYDGFLIYTTEEVSPGVIDVYEDDVLVYDGGYGIVFSTE
ncbi:MAG TPA: hypothetical protein PLP82_01640 [Deltaproteobacteria bacterium]|nr:hypothetical protein [Deltaproteobacteria bacterium]HNQ85033.1 hypothetical protein [Deltaproteobacteria bacterium]HNS89195.1 hypothetical protein [Deltaproteobacteria bacterium]HOA45104.1 hypothetical protein [Deltaproteobacteria bacterium]HOC75459.1 hypothetical protein [Deltaproteobacteria bacterium]